MYWPGYGWGRGMGRGGGGGRGFGRGWGFGFQQIQNLPQLPPPNGFRIAIGTLDSNGLDALISPRFARAPYMTFVDIRDGYVTYIQSIQNTLAELPHGAGMAVAQWLISNNVKAIIAVNLGPNITYALQQAGISIYYTQPNIRVRDALRILKLANV